MISDLTLIFARPDSYTALVGGNSGEDELVISCSPGQDGRAALSLVAMSVDGRAKRLPPSPRFVKGTRGGFALVNCSGGRDLFDAIRGAIFDWGHIGIEPTQAEREVLLEQSWNLAHSILTTWGALEAWGAESGSPEEV